MYVVKTVSEDERLHSICGTVVLSVKKRLLDECKRRGVKQSKLVGEIVTRWASELDSLQQVVDEWELK